MLKCLIRENIIIWLYHSNRLLDLLSRPTQKDGFWDHESKSTGTFMGTTKQEIEKTLWHSSLLKNVVERESQFGLAVHIRRRLSGGWDAFFRTWVGALVKMTMNIMLIVERMSMFAPFTYKKILCKRHWLLMFTPWLVCREPFVRGEWVMRGSCGGTSCEPYNI